WGEGGKDALELLQERSRGEDVVRKIISGLFPIMIPPRLSLLVPALLILASACDVAAGAAEPELKVHLAQANNDSPYAFVRAKFEPGEVTDPWAVRFYDDAGKEVPYFVWDSVSWRVAREGREDWGKRFALINHAPGDAPEVLA